MENETQTVEFTPSESPSSAALQNMNETERQTWKMTGELPKPAPKEESAPSPAPEVPAVEPEPAASEPAPKQETPEVKMSGAEKRIKQLLARNKELQTRLEAVEVKPAEVKPAPAPASPATPPKPTINDKLPDGSSKYETYEDFLDARDTWNEARTQERIQAALKTDREAQTKAQREAEVARENEAVERKWNERVVRAGKKHPDFTEVALAPDTLASIPKGSVLDAFILESDSGAEILYALAAQPDEMARIASLAPLAQARELVKLEISLTSGTPAPPKTTSAPPPPAELSAKGSPPPDEVTSALQHGDFAAYRRAANARELTSRKG